jgi:phage virion morphogenesis protein
MLRLKLQLDPTLNLLALLAGRLANRGALLASAAPVVARAVEQNFDEEGRPVRWPPLAPATLRRKPAGLRILERTGRLRRSVQVHAEGNALVASTDVPYAAAHQFGVPRRHLPARPFLVLTAEDQEAIAQTIADTLEETTDEARGTPHPNETR